MCGRGGRRDGLKDFFVNLARGGLWHRSKRYRIRAISEREVRIRPKELVRAVPGRSGERLQPILWVFEVFENLFDNCRIFDTSDHPDGTAALLAGLDIDLEYPFEALRPGHGGMALGGGFGLVEGLFTAPGRCYLGTVHNCFSLDYAVENTNCRPN